MKERDPGPFLLTVCHWGVGGGPLASRGEKMQVRPRRDSPGKKSGPVEIYRETEILRCRRGPKTALAIPARLVCLLRVVDMLWKYILFMKKRRVRLPKEFIIFPQMRLCGPQPSLGGRGAWSAAL